jgi:hypothetical protein
MFDDALGPSSFWAMTTAEYGVAPAASGPANHVRMAQPLPATLGYLDLQSFVMTNLQAALSNSRVADGGTSEGGPLDGGSTDGSSDAGTMGGAPDSGMDAAGPPDPIWPAPTLDAHGVSQTIYALFIPPGVAVTDPGTNTSFCSLGSTGYHGSVAVGGANFAYAVTLECPSMAASSFEETASHEIGEAATNPFAASTSAKGFRGFDTDHVAWDLYTGYNDELSDACENWQNSYYEETGSFPYWVQRSWSNKAAAMGHDPCVPAPPGPYHGMTLLASEEQTVAVDLGVVGQRMTSSHGFYVTVGTPLTFHVGFFSDAPTGPWSIGYDFPAQLRTVDTCFFPVGNGRATVSLSQSSGQNGDQVTVTVTPTARGEGGFHILAITWDPPTGSGFAPHYLPILLVDH